MIDFNEIKKKVSTIKDFIGGEKYITLKKNNSINVFNKYDPNSNQLLTNKQKLLIYQTDDPFDKNKEWLCEKYNKIYSVNNKILRNLNIISLPLGIVDTAETISFATCYKKRDFSLFNLLCECRDNFNEEPQKTLYLNYRIPPNFKIRGDAHSIIEHTQSDYTDNTFNGNDWLLFNNKETYIKYFNECLRHKYIQCPEGFGIDSYRFYETLYLGRIPVVLHNPVTDMFHELPILFLNSWDEFDEKSKEFEQSFNIENYSFEKLSWRYWEKTIND